MVILLLADSSSRFFKESVSEKEANNAAFESIPKVIYDFKLTFS
jgi:hypothetical protein